MDEFVRTAFGTTARSITHHLDSITRFLDHRATNASAESLNANMKLFRAIQKGVTDIAFFLFGLEKLFA
jgi:transposase